MEGSSRSRFAVVVPKLLVKRTKDVLEATGRLDKSIKIKPFSDESQLDVIHGDSKAIQKDTYILPLRSKAEDAQHQPEPLSSLIELIGMREDAGSVCIVRMTISADARSNELRTNLLASTINQWVCQTAQFSSVSSDSCSMPELLKSYNWSYSVYEPLLLLAPSTFSNLLSVSTAVGIPNNIASLYPLLCKNFKVTHIALNAPIPDTIPSVNNLHESHDHNRRPELREHGGANNPNIFRSPTGLMPLYGAFGPSITPDHKPTVDDFTSGFWCTAQQNGIFQTWAPRYTMFSRGNISEKARILTMSSLQERRLEAIPSATSAVDLYAGIGYFAFSYAKADVGKVLCWEINPWSVEGLRRGAVQNHWGARIAQCDDMFDSTAAVDERLLVFQESNECAVARINAKRACIPAVRHINCGFLPSSKDSWETAVQVLDQTIGGWVHAHENIAKKDISTRVNEVVEIFTDLVKKYCVRGNVHQWKIQCEHVEQVKSYAPGVMHCVMDVAIGPRI